MPRTGCVAAGRSPPPRVARHPTAPARRRRAARPPLGLRPSPPRCRLRRPAPRAPVHAPTTSTNSPRAGMAPLPAASASSPSVPRETVSWSFVSSRHTAAGRSGPHAVARSRSVPATRFGASNTIAPRSSAAIRASRSRRSRPERGRNPSNVQCGPATPDTATAVTTADGPGSATTVPPSPAHAATSSPPGSLTTGVPASLTSARSAPAPQVLEERRRRAPARSSRGSWSVGTSIPWRSAAAGSAACPRPR